MVKPAHAKRPRVGDVVRVPWGLDVATGDVIEIQGPPTHPHAVVALPVLGSRGEILDITTVTFPLDAIEVVEAQVIEDRDVTPPGMDGWVHRYRVEVDGDAIMVNVWCTGTSEAMAQYRDDIKSIVRDRGRAWAVRAAAHAQPGRETTATVRCDSSGPSITYEYGRPAAKAP